MNLTTKNIIKIRIASKTLVKLTYEARKHNRYPCEIFLRFQKKKSENRDSEYFKTFLYPAEIIESYNSC